jgi:arsenite methyltransferase
MTSQRSPGGQGNEVRDHVRRRYAAAATAVTEGGAATCCGGSCCAPAGVGAGSGGGVGAGVGVGYGAGAGSACGAGSSGSYRNADREQLPAAAVAASLGCGNPLAVVELRPGERVLDLGCGGGIDVLLSARRVGPGGRVYGLDMTEEMLELARANARQAGLTNVEFLPGTIEAIPLPGGCVDVVISNCVINLSTDKAAVFAEAFRVLVPGGRLGVFDIVAEDHLTPRQRAERGGYTGCIAGALSFAEYRAGLAAAGLTGISLTPSHQVADGMHSVIIRAVKPRQTPSKPEACGAHRAGGCTSPVW